eukprot:INCI5000.3.p1 GENE.INCI5000.3~~INCI5000.3.p1  ORF type:complete len:126 (+),score=12.52 INCI5000.3:1093-1470(+)
MPCIGLRHSRRTSLPPSSSTAPRTLHQPPSRLVDRSTIHRPCLRVDALTRRCQGGPRDCRPEKAIGDRKSSAPQKLEILSASKQLLGLVGEVVEDERLLYQQGNRIEKERAPSTHPREKAQERED